MAREWRTVASIAAELGIHTMTVYRLIGAGKLDAVKVGRSYRIKEADFQKYLKEARAHADPRQ